jgi:hypothetical protein
MADPIPDSARLELRSSCGDQSCNDHCRLLDCISQRCTEAMPELTNKRRSIADWPVALLCEAIDWVACGVLGSTLLGRGGIGRADCAPKTVSKVHALVEERTVRESGGPRKRGWIDVLELTGRSVGGHHHRGEAAPAAS